MKISNIFMASAALLVSCSSAPDYVATGIFEATTVTVSAETTGKILTMAVSEGDSVKAQARIALIDTAMLAIQRMQIMNEQRAAEASSPDVAAQVASLRSQIDHWQSEVARQEHLLADGATTQKQYADAQSQLRTLRSQLSAQLSTLGKNRTTISDNAVALQYRREQVEDQINRCAIESPISCKI